MYYHGIKKKKKKKKKKESRISEHVPIFAAPEDCSTANREATAITSRCSDRPTDQPAAQQRLSDRSHKVRYTFCIKINDLLLFIMPVYDIACMKLNAAKTC